MIVRFKTLTLTNFKNHQDLTVNFGERTEITGDNAKGKSSILEAITFLLYGVDPLGSKVDPTPITYKADETKVQLLININEKDVLLGRAIKKNKAQYYINEVPTKAGDFNDLINSLFDKELFMSLFNPHYFPSLHWEKQRAMVLQYVPAPYKKDVLKHMPEGQALELGELFKKYSLDEIEAINKENKKKLEKQYIAAQSRTKTLKEQLESYRPSVPKDSLLAELNDYKRKREAIEKETDKAGETNSRINVLQRQINALLKERSDMKEQYELLKAEPIEDTCRVCKQSLQGEAINAAVADKDERLNKFKEQFNKVVKERKALEEELATLEYVDLSDQMNKIREIQEKISSIELEINKHNQFEQLMKQCAQAEKEESETLVFLNRSIFTLDTVKAFRAKEAELQGNKVQELFDTLSIKLFEQLKNGELKPTFEIEMDGKPYSKLSLSESIRAGLELREVLSKQSELVLPVFIDNAESITSFKKPSGQLITAKVIAGQELQVKAVET